MKKKHTELTYIAYITYTKQIYNKLLITKQSIDYKNTTFSN